MDQKRLAQLALHFIPGIGNYTVKQLISYSGSAENVFKSTKAKLLKIPGVGPATAEAILNHRPFERAEEELQLSEKHNTRLLLYSDKDFPNRLKHINDAPSLLYYQGNADLNAKKVVAVVGTRNATRYGREFTEKLIEGLEKHDVLVVSGLAYGIDIQAHKSALKHQLSTVGVMASGMDFIYPALHKNTAREMTSQGGLLTEHSFGTKPEPPKFPARNRIIAGMADAIIVVEAARKGGALITAEIANSYSRDVFALPGEVGQPYSEGCNNLIKMNKAHLLTAVDDVEYIMNWEKEDAEKQEQHSAHDISLLNDDEKLVFLQLQEYQQPILIDNLSWQTQLPVSKLASILLNLEFKGLVSALPGKSYKLAR
ncbi:Rossmann fold nucleotide-binding protein Smf [Fulvivirga imtechensis AK7]|uniref:Rossmann fold nucleotide-binding protein Smf n=1 Tax=Fulvivirga imtechensis AK7 TaxID=1237149 RepID=L8K1K0_9BACT|nr:DNA-processing protein DprA [Fulvivirga imtechensis]ELR73799.1 Rossmann fold nucleotide-binding protein Smf [Fulvivirga imtechensis AK7]